MCTKCSNELREVDEEENVKNYLDILIKILMSMMEKMIITLVPIVSKLEDWNIKEYS